MAPASTGPLAKRFRLAGTFFAFGEPGAQEGNYCKAILDDALKKEQYLVREGDTVEGIHVVRIYQDRVVLRNQGVEEELWLSFANALADRPPAGTGPGRRTAEADETPALEVNRFGKRVGENRWVLSREALKGYYREMLDDPERLALLYVSMKPQYKEGAIAGYTMDMEGEKDFFTSAGLRNGDIIRKVNSMNMTSQRRAEYFIGEFAKDRLNAVVLDVERNNQPQKLIYMIR
jgi:type II secretion system protein C